jgi:hypothetical protein
MGVKGWYGLYGTAPALHGVFSPAVVGPLDGSGVVRSSTVVLVDCWNEAYEGDAMGGSNCLKGSCRIEEVALLGVMVLLGVTALLGEAVLRLLDGPGVEVDIGKREDRGLGEEGRVGPESWEPKLACERLLWNAEVDPGPYGSSCSAMVLVWLATEFPELCLVGW